MLNWPPVEVFLKTAPQPVVDASVVGNEGFPILIVLNDPRILVFHQFISCLPSQSIEVFFVKISFINFQCLWL